MEQQKDIPQKNNPVFSKETYLLLALLCLLPFLITSCGDNSTGPGSENGNGNGNGEPLEPTFANVQQIFTENCGPCHIGGSTSGVRLDSYDNVMNSNGEQYDEPVVIAEDPDNSPIIDKVSNNNPEFGDRMPQDGPSLSSDEISLIRDWIDDGAPDN